MQPVVKPRSRLWAPTLVLALAALLRLVHLATVPFGWHPDEATKALLALDVLAGKYFPAFFSAFTGREALYVYLEAGLLALLGDPLFAGRLLSASVGLLTVALTYALGVTLFNRRAALLAAAFLAVSLWHLIASRNGYRAVIQPLAQLPALILLWRGLWGTGARTRPEPRRMGLDGRGLRSAAYFAGAGFFLGLTQYTYTAVRIFPFVVAALAGLALAAPPAAALPRRAAAILRGLLLTAGLALVVFAPLGWHFWQNPGDFFGRAAQISVFAPEWSGGDPAARLWQSVKETARMWTAWGDINYRFNVAGQPVFGAADGALFYAGIGLSLWRGVRRTGKQRAAYLLPLLWTPIMLVPMLLSAESLPYYQRAIGVLPAVYFFPALALDGLLAWLERAGGRLGRLARRPQFGALTVFVVLGYLGLRTAGDYFGDWHTAPRNDDDRRAAMVYVADYLRETAVAGDLYLSTQYPQHPTLALLAPERYDGVHWFDARTALPLPPPGAAATYLLLAENAPQPALLARVPALQAVETGYDRFERPVFTVYRWEDGARPAPADRAPAIWSWETTFAPGDPQGLRNPIGLPVNFGDVLRFVGHDRNTAEPAPGAVLELTLYWETQQRPARAYTFFAHLLNAEGQVVAGFDANDYPTPFWRAAGGEMLLSYFPLFVPPDAPPGVYQVEIGVYHQPTGERLPVLDQGQAVADRLLLATVTVQ